MTAQVVIDVFNQARRLGLIKRNVIIYSAQGSQYAAVEYRRLLYMNGFRQSMSRKGNCYDNAQAESFFSRFKAEFVENGTTPKTLKGKQGFLFLIWVIIDLLAFAKQ